MLKNFTKKDKKLSVFKNVLAVVLAVMLVSTGLTIMPGKVHAAGFIPRDAVTVKVLSDGTHNGPGTTTFINSKNGYVPGDNTPTDRVVSSGDTVVYGVDLDVKAGPERTVDIKFSNVGKGDALQLNDFSSLKFNSAIVSATPISGGVRVKIARGAVATLNTTIGVRGKDTKGTVVGDNKVKAELKNGDYSFTSITPAVTVVSAPFADLTVQGSKNTAISGEKAKGTGSFQIIPRELQPQGYSRHGLSASGEWRTDIDVSDFPKGTEFRIDGKVLPVQNGIIKDVKDSDPIEVEYKFVETPVDLHILKTDKNSGKPIANTEFSLQKTTFNSLDEANSDSNLTGTAKTLKTDSSGKIAFPKVESGVYRLKETAAASGYDTPEGVWFVELRYDSAGLPFSSIKSLGETPNSNVVQSETGKDWGEIQIQNAQSNYLLVKKVDENGKPISGSKFALQGSDGKTVSIGTDPVQLSPGTYTLTEIQAPKGHTLLAKPVVFNFSNTGISIVSGNSGMIKTGTANNNTYELIVGNLKAGVLPKSGGEGAYWGVTAGILALSAAAGAFAFRRREH